MIKFPQNFFWGSATSAYQVEGNNSNSDWWEWEKRINLKDVSGEACRHYEFYKKDIDLAKLLNHNVHRFSVEWSRVEPEEGRFSLEELDHYREVILYLRQQDIEPVVTLHHFTNPLWLVKSGGWQSRKTQDYFARYVERVVESLGDKVRFWVTINEPMVYMYQSYILGVWPPQEKSFLKARQVARNLAGAHIKAYRVIHNLYNKKGLSSPSVSIAKSMQSFVPCNLSLKNKLAVFLRNSLFNFNFVENLARNKSLDFIGLNYYTRSLIDLDRWSINSLLLDTCKKDHNRLNKNSLGWEIYPQGLYQLLIDLKKYNLPVFILENGICTEDDNARWDFIREHLKNLYRAINEGVEVLGYLYWSLMDNFEWDKGFAPRFGIIEIDYKTYERRVRESAKKFSLVCKTGILD